MSDLAYSVATEAALAINNLSREVAQLRERVQQLEKLMAHVIPDKSDDIQEPTVAKRVWKQAEKVPATWAKVAWKNWPLFSRLHLSSRLISSIHRLAV